MASRMVAAQRANRRMAEEDPDEDAGSDVDEDEDLVSFGVFTTKIVGIQYYNGTVNNNEMVRLVREPENQYDSWAIRVDNVQGVKVGHLGRMVVCHLSPLVDRGLVRVEGYVPRGSNNIYSIPAQVYLFGKPENKATVLAALRRGGVSPIAAAQDADGNALLGDAEGTITRMSKQALEESLDRLFDDLLKESGPLPMMDPDPEVTSTLYPHQRQALCWMVQRENSNCLPPFWQPHGTKNISVETLKYVNNLTNFISDTRPAPLRGGILCDDMGLGKTLEVIALLATNRPGVPMPQPYSSATDEPPAKKRRKTKAAADGEQAGPSLLQKSAAKGKGKLAEAAAAAEPPPTLPDAAGPRGTLIVCPLSVLTNWQLQLEEHTRGSMQVYVYHGTGRVRDPKFLEKQDVVITTYSTLPSEIGMRDGVLQARFLRVVLDEAHCIKNSASQQARGAAAIRAERRWAITGTPLQNNLLDLYGLLAFLQLDPLKDKSIFTRTIDRPIKAADARGLKRLQVMMGQLALRRTKDMMVDGKPLVALPPKVVSLVTVQLTPDDQLVYNRWEDEGRKIIGRHLSDNTLLQNYTTVLEIILRLRQICNSASLCPARLPSEGGMAPAASPADPATMERLVALLRAGGGEECPICLNELLRPCITLCAHLFCRRCIEAVISRDKAACPMCRAPISAAQLIEPPPEEEKDEEGGSQPGPEGAVRSAKITALLQRLKAAAEEGASGGGGAIKSVVFSQFTGMLNLVEAALKAEGITYVRLDGSTSVKKRGELLRAFAARDGGGGPTVFLASLKAGGVGLNLVAASHVHILDVWWNPAVEEQAMDRVHRLGQSRAVAVWRYVVAGSIEERMLALQDSKRDLLKAVFDRQSPEEQRATRIRDVKLLMEL